MNELPILVTQLGIAIALLNDEQLNKNELPISVKELENVNGESKDLHFIIK
jgi:hypothetical protein